MGRIGRPYEWHTRMPWVLPVLVVAMVAAWAAGSPPATHAQFVVDIKEMLPCELEDVPGLTTEEQAELARCLQARGLILENCTLCHTFVPIVLQQFDEGAWTGLIDRHRVRVTHLSEDEIQTIRWYLIRTFNPDNPPPPVPPELLEDWTSY